VYSPYSEAEHAVDRSHETSKNLPFVKSKDRHVLRMLLICNGDYGTDRKQG